MAQYENGFRVANPLNRSQVKTGSEPQRNHKAIWTDQMNVPLDTVAADAGKSIP